MEALRKQASKLKEQVAKQQQAVIKQFGGTGYESSDVMVIDEAELQRHQQLEKLYRSTRAGRDFQKDIIRAAEGFATIGYRHIEIGISAQARILVNYGHGLGAGMFWSMLSQYQHLAQIMEPLRAMVAGAPLEDARNLAQRYSRMRHDAESLAAEISRRQFRVREAPMLENTTKLQSSKAKMHELKANMAVLGKEAAAALAAVESQQQRLTFQRLLAMVEAEKSFHLRVAAVLDDAEAEMVSEKQQKESAPPLSHKRSEKALYFLAEAMYSFNAASEKELSLVVGDYVVVRQDSISVFSIFTHDHDPSDLQLKKPWYINHLIQQPRFSSENTTYVPLSNEIAMPIQ
ncbi:SH3 domain-containing protein 3 [Cocos nucifera]|uniref:SH3 domain-containing protein 3 n=1 Tax=Cocos nucifera TaxID=13894 RepID=A0A8K0N3B3_COCNU|nr:SH3 domain-containing protein 3 [Cocos nucifera]